MFNWITKSLARTILIPVIASIVLGVVCFVYYVNTSSYEMSVTSEGRAAGNLTRIIASALDLFIEDTVASANVAAGDPDVIETLTAGSNAAQGLCVNFLKQ